MHWVGAPLRWLESERAAGSRVLGVELADEAVRLADRPAARQRSVAVAGSLVLYRLAGLL